MIRFFSISLILTLAAIVFAGVSQGLAAALTVSVLIAIEIAFSFDNAIINAKVLERLSRLWQQLFLTIGMVVAIVGVRFVLPIIIVMITADLSWSAVLNEALNDPTAYGEHLAEAHIAISSFGGGFLLALTMYFFLDDGRKVLWLSRIERPLQKFGGSFWLPLLLSLLVIVILAVFAGEEAGKIIQSGFAGVILYSALKLFIDWLGSFAPKEQKLYTGWPAFFAFMYLQLLDASFSLDGVLGAFAVTNQVLLIALGLGVGAIWVRSLTVYLVRHGALNTYEYLEHGAHYAIFVLAAALLGSIYYEVPDALTGVVGIGVIASSFWTSQQLLKTRKARS